MWAWAWLLGRPVSLVTSIVLIVLAAVIPAITPNYEESRVTLGDHDMFLSINETLDLFEKRINSMGFCVKTRACELYALDIAIIARPSSNNYYYNVYIEVSDDNYTRSSYLLANNLVIRWNKGFFSTVFG